MAYRAEWDSDRRLILCTSFGTVDGQEVCDLIRDVAHEGRCEGGGEGDRSRDPSLDVCCDWRAVRGLIVVPTDLPDIVARMRWFATEHPYGRTAIVTSRVLDQTMAKLLVRMTSDGTRDRKHFGRMDEAEAWLTQSLPEE